MLPIKISSQILSFTKNKLLANFGHGILQINHQSILSLYKTQKSYQINYQNLQKNEITMSFGTCESKLDPSVWDVSDCITHFI